MHRFQTPFVAAMLFVVVPTVSTADVEMIPLPEEGPGIWLRRVVSLKSPTTDAATSVQVTGSAVVSVYFNGQQLARNEAITDGATLRFDVTSLVRDGQNGIAIAAHRSNESDVAIVAAWLAHQDVDGRFGTGKRWKQKLEAPPVGWQHTDFNPHGWTNVGSSEPMDTDQLDIGVEDRTWRRPPVIAGFEGPFQFVDGDHVVILGGTFVERSQNYGHLESMLACRAADKRVTFRNLGWSGDTVAAESRGIFESPDKGYRQMVEQIRAEEPTLIVVCYGQNEAMTDAGKLAQQAFRQRQIQLHSDLSSTGARFLFVAPHPLLHAAAPIPSPTRFNRAIEDYAVQVRDVARELDQPFADLTSDFPTALEMAQNSLQPDQLYDGDLVAASLRWTDNGMHFNDDGYRRMGLIFAERCFQSSVTPPQLSINFQRQTIGEVGLETRNVEWKSDGTLSLEIRSGMVRAVPIRVSVESSRESSNVQMNSMQGDSAARLIAEAPGNYLLYDNQYDALRSLIQQKNELYFHRWRPQNITYLYLFRKHEQGNNAAEIAMFDPLVDQLEQEIHAAQQPEWRRLTVW